MSAAIEDPFRHLPALRELIVDPAHSRYRYRDLAELDRKMLAAGLPSPWRRSDEEREATRIEALAGRTDGDLWVFAYGSLMWDPAFHFVEVRSAVAEGYRRSFCLRSVVGRGSPERPGLMAALDLGGRCHGLAYRIARHAVEAETGVLWRREMIMPGYDPLFVSLATPQGAIDAMAFVVRRDTRHYVGDLAFEETARMIATGAGLYGTNLQYLHNLARHFGILGFDDEDFFRLYERARAIAEAATAK